MSAVFSTDRKYRYSLTRDLGELGVTRRVVFIGLNPSTANETKDDPTIRRCVAFARQWAFGELVMVNLFALVSADPRALEKDSDPVGPENEFELGKATAQGSLVIAAWGAFPQAKERGESMKRFAAAAGFKLHHLGLTKDGSPRHPLYLHRATKPQVWS